MKTLKKFKEMVRPFDVIIVIVLSVFSFVPAMIFAYQHRNIPYYHENIAIVSINNNEVDRFVLTEDTPHQLIKYTEEDGLRSGQFNIIEVEGTRIRVKEDNSPDQVAVMTGWISRPGQTSICLPHRLMIRIESVNPEASEEDEIIIAG